MTDEKLAEKWIAKYTGVDVKTQRAIQLQAHKNLKEAFLAGRQSNNKCITELEEINADLKQSLDWANDREKENVNLIIKMRSLLKEVYNEFGFSELVKIRNNLPMEIQEII